jgi:hypothetical protein
MTAWLRALLACPLALVLAACVNPALVPVKYDSAVTRTSEKSGSLHMTTGSVESDYAPGQIAQVRVNPKVLFNLDDQRAFAESLKNELNRSRLLRVTDISWQQVEPADVTVEIVFQRTIVFPVAVRYLLDVAMRLKSGERSFSRRYFVSSSEGESTWTNLNTDAAKGKALAATKLMARLIPDIEQFVSASQ